MTLVRLAGRVSEVLIEVEYWVVAVLELVELMLALNVALTLASQLSFTPYLKLASTPAFNPQVKESVMVETSVLLAPTVTVPLEVLSSVSLYM